MAGKVTVNGRFIDKPGIHVESGSLLVIVQPDNPYVSRGGKKLEGAIKDLDLDLEGLTILDVGASTGGFTDCLLQHGAAKVFALDVGYGQLDQKLRNDPRVIVMERSNVRNLRPGDLGEAVDLATIDLSFISLKLVLPVLSSLPVPTLLALVKPQFEVGKADAAKGRGVIRDPALHRAVLEEIVMSAAERGYYFQSLTYSKLPGPKGNLEFFLLLDTEQAVRERFAKEQIEAIERIVAEAHAILRC